MIRAISSVGSEHLVYTEGVGGSSPSSPTFQIMKACSTLCCKLFLFSGCKQCFLFLKGVIIDIDYNFWITIILGGVGGVGGGIFGPLIIKVVKEERMVEG